MLSEDADLNSYTEKAYAKINLYLDIEKRRQDGYHDIISLMQNVSLCDVIKITKSEDDGIIVVCSREELNESPQKNLAYLAADLFFDEFNTARRGVKIEIEKNIPVAAGMAGGSADAAATLRCLNRIYGNPFSIKELCEMGKRLGADVPFCIAGGAYITRGIGDILIKTEGLSEDSFVVIACGDDKISTPAAYNALDQKFNNFGDRVSGNGFEKLLAALKEDRIDRSTSYMYNIFEEVSHNVESVSHIKRVMNDSGALISMMSGSGPSVFGIFDRENNANKAVQELINQGIVNAGVYRPITSI